MSRKRASRLAALAAAGVLLVGTAGATSAANPSVSYSFTACWDDGTVSGLQGLRGLQSWSGIRVNGVTFGFANLQFGEAFSIPGSRIGSEWSGWHTPQSGGGDFVGTLMIGRHVVASGSIPEPSGGWSTLSPCPVD